MSALSAGWLRRAKTGHRSIQRIYQEPQPPYMRLLMRGSRLLLCAAVLFTFLALISAPTANAQIVVGIRVPSVAIGIGVQPVCSYGYYGYAPYACAPYGYYGSGYFYNGIFLGMGPWANWGYGHGWGDHRFAGYGGGRYFGGDGRGQYRNVPGDRGHGYGDARGAMPNRGVGRVSPVQANRGNGGARSYASQGGSPARSGGGGGPARGGGGPARGGGGPARGGGGPARGGDQRR